MSKVGKIGMLIQQQGQRMHFSEIPVGSKFAILEEVDLPAYDILACFFEFKPQILKDGSKFWNGYVERGSYIIIEQ